MVNKPFVYKNNVENIKLFHMSCFDRSMVEKKRKIEKVRWWLFPTQLLQFLPLCVNHAGSLRHSLVSRGTWIRHVTSRDYLRFRSSCSCVSQFTIRYWPVYCMCVFLPWWLCLGSAGWSYRAPLHSELPDSDEGSFQMYTLHCPFAVERNKGERREGVVLLHRGWDKIYCGTGIIFQE